MFTPDEEAELEAQAIAQAEMEYEQQQANRIPNLLHKIGGAMTNPLGAIASVLPKTPRDISASMMNLIPGELGDEAVAYAMAPFDAWGSQNAEGGQDLSIQQALERGLSEARGVRESFAQENPVADIGQKALGAFTTPMPGLVKGAVGNIARQGAYGASLGALTGFGAGVGTEDRLDNLIPGAGAGGVLGAGGAIVGELAGILPEAGKKLQRAAYGITKRPLEKAQNMVGKGKPNPLIEDFESLQNEGVVSFGNINPEVAQRKIAERAYGQIDPQTGERVGGIVGELNPLLAQANEVVPSSVPYYRKSFDFIKRNYDGTDLEAATEIFNNEVRALASNPDKTLSRWNDAKIKLGKNTKYGSDKSSMENAIRQKIREDLKIHVETNADKFIPEQAGQVKALNKKLSEGERVGEVVNNQVLLDQGRDLESFVRKTISTTGGYGQSMIVGGMAGGSEYGRSGSIANAAKVAAIGAIAGSRRGKYATGAILKQAPFVNPSIIARASTPIIVKAVAERNQKVPETPSEMFKAGATGVNLYKETTASDPKALDTLYQEATSDFRNFAAPNGKVDPAKARKWAENNGDALSAIPELKTQITNPSSAQMLIDRHFGANAPLNPEEIDSFALQQYTIVEPQELMDGIFTSDKVIQDLRQTVNYVKSDKEALSGLRKEALNYVSQTPEMYLQNRKALELGGLFTTSQLRIADSLYGKINLAEDANTSLSSLMRMANGSFLNATSKDQYLNNIEPTIRDLGIDEVESRIKRAMLNPSLSRDLLNKNTPLNVAKVAQSIFSDVLQKKEPEKQATPPAPPSTQSPIATKSFPTPQDLRAPAGGIKKTSWSKNPETNARIQVESSGNPWAVSPKGAEGLSQIMPATGMEIGQQLGETYMPLRANMTPAQQMYSQEQNVRFGDYYYNQQLKTFKNPVLARVAYNAGPGRVQNAIKAAKKTNPNPGIDEILARLPEGVKKESIPYNEKIGQIIQRTGAQV